MAVAIPANRRNLNQEIEMNVEFKFSPGQTVQQASFGITGRVEGLYTDESGAKSVLFKYASSTGEIKTRWELEDALAAI